MQQFLVGPGRQIPNGVTYGQVAGALQRKGDMSMFQDVSIIVDPGPVGRPTEYENDTWWMPKVTRNFTLDGGGNSGAKARIINRRPSGMPQVPGQPFSGSGADKGLFWDAGVDVVIRGFEVEGARSQSGAYNGSGVRMDRGTNLTLERMIFRYCQNGALISPQDLEATEADERGNLIIKTCEFSCCGFGGQAHLLYCGTTITCFVDDSIFTHAVGEGNTFKTRSDYTRVRSTLLTTGSGFNSWVYDSMGGKNELHFNTFQNLAPFSSQPKGCVHIYIEPQSKDVEIDIQYNLFDLRGKAPGKPIVVDPRILYNGTGGIGEDGKFHKKGENYYVQGEFRDMVGIVDNNIVLINPDQRNHFGYDPATGQNKMVFPWNDVRYGPIPLPPGLVEGPNNKFVVTDAPPADDPQSTDDDGCDDDGMRHGHKKKRDEGMG
jgi:hypothetical protein